MATNPQGTDSAAQAVVFDNLGIDSSEFETGGDDLDLGGEGQGGQVGGRDSGGGRDGGVDNLDAPGVNGRGIPTSAEVRPDKFGNLRSPDGKLVARAGAEARRYQELHNTRGRLSQTEATTRDLAGKLNHTVQVASRLNQELAALKGQQEAVNRFGLKPDEHIRALELFSMLRDNPEQALKTLLTRAAAHGINLGNITGGASGVDAKALMDMVRDAIGKEMNPLRERAAAEQQQRQNQQRQDQINQQATEEVNSFFTENRDAVPYLPVFQAVLSQPQFSKMTLGEIWARIQLQAHLNPPPKGGANGRTGTMRGRGLPSGRPNPAGGPQGDDTVAPVSQSYDSILNDILDKAGVAR